MTSVSLSTKLESRKWQLWPVPGAQGLKNLESVNYMIVFIRMYLYVFNRSIYGTKENFIKLIAISKL